MILKWKEIVFVHKNGFDEIKILYYNIEMVLNSILNY